MAAIDFIADEAENGIDFTPDPSPFVAQAPRPIIPPPQLAGDERAARRAILMAELQNEAARGQRTENIANRLGLLEGAIRPFASTPDNPLGGIGSALKGAGQIVAPITEASGNVAVGLFSDIGMGGIQRGSFPLTSRALSGGQVGNVDDNTPLLPRIAEGAVRGLGQMVPALAATAAGVPSSVAFGGQMGLTEYGTSGDISKAMTQAAVGGLLGKVSEVGTAGGGLLGSRVAAKLPAALETPIVVAGEFAGRQALQNTLTTSGMLPELIQAYLENPAKGADMLAESIGVNLAFEFANLPKTVRDSIAKDHAQAWLKDPHYLNKVDALTTQRAQPRRAQVMLPETMRELAKAPAIPKAAEAAPVPSAAPESQLLLTPTVRIGEQSFKGKAHPLAIGEASKKLAADAPIEDLFKPESQGFTATDPATGKERFITRKEAAEIFQKQTGKKTAAPDKLTSEDLRDARLLGHMDEKPAAAPGEQAQPKEVATKPEVVKLATSKYKNPQGDPMGTTYRGTAEDFKAYQDAQAKIKALRDEDPGLDKPETMEKIQAAIGENERIKNKYGGMPPETPATAPEPAKAAPAPSTDALPTDLPALARLRITKPELREQIDSKIADLREGAQPSAASALKELPPIPDGHVRLFHGEGGPQGGGTGGAFYTSNITKASTFGPDVSWVDLPTAKATAAFAKAKASAFAGGDSFILEAADISRSKKINQKVEPPTHVLDEPSAPPAAPAPRGIAASVRKPGGMRGDQAGFISLAPAQAAIAGAKAARDTVGNVVRFYSQPLTERLASEGGTNAKGFANMSNEIAQRSKELFGSLTPVLDPALEATGKMNRTTLWLNDIAPTNQKWGYRNAVKAVEGPIGNVPADHVATVNQLKAANLAIGQLPQGVVAGYRASGRYQRPPTASFVDAIRSGKGPLYETAMRALATENRIPIARVKQIFKDIKAEFDEPGSGQTVHKIAQEFQRQFPKFPTDLKISTPLGEMWVPILHAKPFDYLLHSAQTTAQRVSFLERIPTNTLPQLRKDVVAELKDPAAFDDLVRALHGLPVNEPLRLFAPGTMQEMIASGANRVLTDVFSSLKLTASAIYNIPETVLGNTPAFFGWRNFLEGAATLKGRHARLETLGAVNRAIYNFSIDPKAPIRTTLSMFRQGVRKATAQQFFNEMQEMLAASTAQVFSERAEGRVLSAHEQSLFTETATAMGFARPAANSMARGTGTSDQYVDFVRRAASFATGGNIQPAELSRFGANRILNGLFRFQSYPIMKLNAFRKAYVNLAEAAESKNSARIKASSEQMAKFLFNTTAQGAATAFVAAFLTGRGGGVEQTAEDALEEPGKFIFDSVASGIGGPVAAINYAVGTGQVGDLLNPKNLNAGITFPGSIYLELKQLFNTEGPYEGMSLKQAAEKYSRTKIPAGKMINRALEEAGLVSGSETTRRNLFRLYDKWLEKQTDPKIKADYERRQAATFPVSKYKSLDAALSDRDEARAIKSIQSLTAEGQKNRDILERMRPFVGEGINSRVKPLFHGSYKMEAAFRNSLNPEQKAEYQKAMDERKATYQEFLKVWRKRGTAVPKARTKIDFVPDAGQ